MTTKPAEMATSLNNRILLGATAVTGGFEFDKDDEETFCGIVLFVGINILLLLLFAINGNNVEGDIAIVGEEICPREELLIADDEAEEEEGMMNFFPLLLVLLLLFDIIFAVVVKSENELGAEGNEAKDLMMDNCSLLLFSG